VPDLASVSDPATQQQHNNMLEILFSPAPGMSRCQQLMPLVKGCRHKTPITQMPVCIKCCQVQHGQKLASFQYVLLDAICLHKPAYMQMFVSYNSTLHEICYWCTYVMNVAVLENVTFSSSTMVHMQSSQRLHTRCTCSSAAVQPSFKAVAMIALYMFQPQSSYHITTQSKRVP
jgi:hypothetical protein